jgi:hypothetical protein
MLQFVIHFNAGSQLSPFPRPVGPAGICFIAEFNHPGRKIIGNSFERYKSNVRINYVLTTNFS